MNADDAERQSRVANQASEITGHDFQPGVLVKSGVEPDHSNGIGVKQTYSQAGLHLLGCGHEFRPENNELSKFRKNDSLLFLILALTIRVTDLTSLIRLEK